MFDATLTVQVEKQTPVSTSRLVHDCSCTVDHLPVHAWSGCLLPELVSLRVSPAAVCCHAVD
jgi:hypothetical protein